MPPYQVNEDVFHLVTGGKKTIYFALQSGKCLDTIPPTVYSVPGSPEQAYMDERLDEQKEKTVNRRRFIGALGAAAAAGAFLERGGGGAEGAPATVPQYQNSFGNVGPAAADTVAAGILPPPVLNGPPPLAPDGATGPAPAYPKYNILMIMVDQMRWPRWLPGSWNDWIGSQFQATLPNLYQLYNMSHVFTNFFVNATPCSPSRACFLTGLYSQETCQFVNQDGGGNPFPPPLQPYIQGGVAKGFPCIGDVLTQSTLNYKCTWIGKWHLSDNPQQPATQPCNLGSTPGMGGPGDYGFNCNGLPGNPLDYNIPGPNRSSKYLNSGGYPSPNGSPNEGTSGEFLGAAYNSGQNLDVPQGYPNLTYPGQTAPSFTQLNDAAIASAFLNQWLTAAVAGNIPQPWFTAVSFINAHDISQFPFSFDLTPSPTNSPTCTQYGSSSAWFSAPKLANVSESGFATPPSQSTQSYPGHYSGESETIPNLPNLYTTEPSPWNVSDDPGVQSYNTLGGKPGLQAYFQSQSNDRFGEICPNNNNSAWVTFLNYYVWMQKCVDYQIGQVLNGPTGTGGILNSSLAGNTVVIFTSDHGDFGGSHNIHGKGGALYDEVMNVPLWISLPTSSGGRITSPIPRSYVCSAVDILPLVYALALGSDSTWRQNSSDIIYYLRGRESIYDGIYLPNASPTPGSANPAHQRRLSCVPNNSPIQGGTADWQVYQPFVFHTTDQFQVGLGYSGSAPCHAIGFRTVDVRCSQTTAELPLGRLPSRTAVASSASIASGPPAAAAPGPTLPRHYNSSFTTTAP
jgi:arylsulfatase A-like enzyme